MAVDLYLYDSFKKVRGVAVSGIGRLKHDERDFMLTAELLGSYGVVSGEYLGFTCIDGRYRLFRVDKAETDTDSGTTIATATEAAVSELAQSVVREVRLESADAETAASAALLGSGFELGKTAKGRSGPINKYFAKRWKVLREIESVCNVRVIPYYEMQDGRITRRVVDIEEKTYRRTGRILQKETDATSIQVTTSGCAIARMYGVGKSIGTEDPPTCVTIEDVEWSIQNGDPANKPAGQAYFEDAELAALGETDEDIYENRNITDPAELAEETYKAFMERRRPKVSGTATAFDIAFLPGYEHKAVQIYDILDVPLKGGGTVEGKVVDVQRDYIRPEQTQIVIGEEKDAAGIVRQVAAIRSETDRLRGSGSAAANRYIENKNLIQMNANRIIMNADEILANAERIRIYAEDLNEATGALAEMQLLLYGDGTSANIGLAARLYDNEEKTGVLSESFALFKADTDTAFVDITARVGENEAAITATATDLGSKIELKADKTYANDLVADEIDAAFAEIEITDAENIVTEWLTVKETATVGALAIGAHAGEWKTTDYVKKVGRTKRYVKSPSDITVEIWEISSIDNGTLNYFGY